MAASLNMYLRFALSEKNPNTSIKDGVFETAYRLSKHATLLEHETVELKQLLRWFGDNLRTPDRFDRNRSKDRHDPSTKGASWFKPSATAHVAKMHRMAAILREQGLDVAIMKTKKPGYVIYEDEHQIVAEPFRELRS